MTRFWFLLGFLGVLATPATADDLQGLEFFESQVRPILVNRCQSCHGEAKQKGGLRLDALSTMLKGGDTGPAVVPGKPEDSLIIEAIGYNDDLRMPPKSKLPEAEVATLKRWVERGAPWPVETAARSDKKAFDFAARAKFWSFQPIGDPPVPKTKESQWPLGAIDSFLLEKLESAGLNPNPDADRRTMIRRVTFDLIGLPPTPEEADAFVSDLSPDAYAKLVNRLLSSPRYGERWGRHWLDLVRYAETAGHEFDYETPDAWRYRDYVIKAFNDDLPYDQFILEQLAGDLLAKPRRNADGTNASVVGTGFFFLGEGTHSPVDLRDDQAIRIDNQVEVMGKSLLGLTINCARCHDHKFDPIRQADYYALSGFMKSSRFDHAVIDSPDRYSGKVADLKDRQADLLKSFTRPVTLADRLTTMTKADPAMLQPGHPLFAWASVCGANPENFDKVRADAQTKAKSSGPDTSVLFEDFNQATYVDWNASGTAFGQGPSGLAALHVGEKGLSPVGSGVAHSGLVSDKLTGILRSKSFPIQHRYVHYRAWGKSGRIHMVVNGFEKIRDPIYGQLAVKVDSPTPGWITQDVQMWVGQSAYLELSDGGTVLYDVGPVGYHQGHGYLAVDEIRFSDSAHAPTRPDRIAAGLLDTENSAELISKYERVAEGALYAWRTGDCLPPERAEWLAWLIDQGWIVGDAELMPRIKAYRDVEGTIPSPSFALTMTEGSPEDAPLSIRGNPHTLGEVVPRRPLEVFGGMLATHGNSGSGRLQLAQSIASSTNPLTARVIVNRLWKHHFGVGLVPSTDDFGAMGQTPSHPQLLDHLAQQLIRSGWSIKAMHRLILASHAYQMSSSLDPKSEQVDPTNVLLHRMRVHRLEAEAIRDTILEVSGRIDRTMYGPSVPTHLTPFMEGRGRPSTSGPLDGNGRRSIYLAIRRNFPSPFLLAFDAPQPNTTIGRRNVSNVPAQALCLLNDPFVLAQSGRLADRVMAGRDKPDDRIKMLYQLALSRDPLRAELEEATRFLGTAGGSKEDWRDLCHVLMNSKAFIFVE